VRYGRNKKIGELSLQEVRQLTMACRSESRDCDFVITEVFRKVDFGLTQLVVGLGKMKIILDENAEATTTT
jgi:hypothetical protein